LLEPPRAFRFCSAAPASRAKPRHGTFFLSTFLDLAANPITSAPHQSAASGELSS
jgi:hypothetical protein